MARHADHMIAELAADQRGLVTRAQLLQRGITAATVAARVRAERFRVVHRGVYLVGPVTVPQAKPMAAVLACGAGAALSHISAAESWRQLPVKANGGASAPIDVAVSGRDCGHRPGIRIHRVALLEAADVTALEGIPITTPLRTLIDLASVVGGRELEQAIARAERNGQVDRDELRAAVATRPGRSGNRLLRCLPGQGDGPAFTRSEAEDRLFALVRKVGLPIPATNVSLRSYEVDFLWRRERLVVEVDGFAFHSSRRRFENDRSRDAALTARGFRVMRVTWRQLIDEPDTVLVRIAQALARGAAG